MSRTLPFRKIAVDLTAGGDPDAIDEPHLVDFGEYPDCPKNPSGTGCHFANPYDPDAPCIYCHKPGGQ